MTTFSYTSGNPNNLIGGSAASMADIQGPFTDIRTFVNGSITSTNLASNAAILETQLAVGSSGMAKGAFSAYRTAALSLATNNVVIFDTEDYDYSSWYDTATGRYTPQVPGVYRFSWSLGAPTMLADQYFQAILMKNGVTLNGLAAMPMLWRNAASGVQSAGSGTLAANGTTDYFSINCQHNNGGSLALYTGSHQTVYFQANLVGRV